MDSILSDIEIYVIIIVAVIWFLIAQQVTLSKTEATNEKLYDTLHGLAEGKLEAKIDTDGDLAIRLKPDQLGE